MSYRKIGKIIISIILVISFGFSIISCSVSPFNTKQTADQVKFVKSLQALRNTKFKSYELIKFLYRVSFSSTQAITEDAGTVVNKIFVDTTAEKASDYISIVVPGMFGGKSFTTKMGELLPGKQKSNIKLSDIITGDIICTLANANDLASGRFYTTDGKNLYDLTDTCKMLSNTSPLDNIANNDLFVILRPSSSITLDTSINTKEIPKGKTDFEKAIIATAESFLLRGDRMQYADRALVQTTPKIYRWERGKSPEDYTSDQTGYSNCTGFVHDVYYNVTGESYGDFKLADSPAEMKAYTYNFTGTETEKEKAQIEAEYKSQLKIGDIVFYTYSTNTHAMLYVGNGNMIHCTGGVYGELAAFKEQEEAAIRYMQLDELFNPESSNRYLFQTAKPRKALYIIRPSNILGTNICDTAKQRIGDMNGIFAEKTASSTLGQTVNAGDNITYTFTVFNTNSKTVSIDITDTIPEHTVLIENAKESNKTDLNWTVKLKPNQAQKVSYTVKVLKTAENGTAIKCTKDSKVGGIRTQSYPVYVGKTLTEKEQEKLRAIVYSKKDSNADSVTFANEIYKELLGVENILGKNIEELKNGIFLELGTFKSIPSTGKYFEMIAPSLYGGRLVLNSLNYDGERTRLPREHNLVTGDILYLQSTNIYGLYIYMGNGELLNLSKGLTKRDITERLSNTIGWSYFAVLRPSLATKLYLK